MNGCFGVVYSGFETPTATTASESSIHHSPFRVSHLASCSSRRSAARSSSCVYSSADTFARSYVPPVISTVCVSPCWILSKSVCRTSFPAILESVLSTVASPHGERRRRVACIAAIRSLEASDRSLSKPYPVNSTATPRPPINPLRSTC